MGSRSQESVEEELREAVDRALRILLRCLPGTPGGPSARQVGEELAVAVRLLDERPYLEVVLDGAGLIRSAAGHCADSKWELARDVLVTARGRLIREHARRKCSRAPRVPRWLSWPGLELVCTEVGDGHSGRTGAPTGADTASALN